MMSKQAENIKEVTSVIEDKGDTIAKSPSVDESFFASPLYDFLYPLRPVTNQWSVKYVTALFALIIRLAVGLGGYSGKNISPMFGDFEAQRHWMEVTLNLPIDKWYFFDLQYWGLDYPPLTAYHSYLLAKLGSFVNNEWFTLNISRGYESDDLQAFMRFTVLLSELFCYIPAVVYFTRWMGKHRNQSPIGQYVAGAAILFQPALILIDHGHFQYNCVMLGMTVYAINNLLDEFYALSAVCFTFALGFKQMALYYAPVIFAYLLSRSIYYPRFNFPRLVTISNATIISFTCLYAPIYISGGFRNIIQSLHRIFPFSRGIFEDKVANFWCVSNILIKYKVLYTQSQLQLYALLATGLGILPSVLITFFYPRKFMIPYTLAACSMSFFLFSFQVHEKSILLPLLPITLLMTSTDWDVLSMVSWINNVALFTLWPLLKKDDLMLQYITMFLFYNWLIGNFSFVTPTFLPKFLTPGPSVSDVADDYRRRSLLPRNLMWRIIIVISYIFMAAIHVMDYFIMPPKAYPDMWVLANCTLGFGCFGLFWLWNHYKMWTIRHKSLSDL
ncbi:HCR003Wp [Eremothecium sinecaudum]|uniref:Alpha-1,3-glucosyltransferase n=1 Tax=Eremothecium sinecaudum TaxID=45286 RepID=A0A0X8HRM1_9SACH|nr:HCR003Wp [Eremothecium sinecaudum]AMD20153.1 HCR003Wp [Eremothecium sinecaudum]